LVFPPTFDEINVHHYGHAICYQNIVRRRRHHQVYRTGASSTLMGKEYTDAGLEEMVKGWRSEVPSTLPAVASQQEKIRHAIKDKLALFMIRRDGNSVIRGKPVMVDYFKLCRVYEDSLVPTDNGAEVTYRENLYKKRFTDSDSLSKTRNDNMCCLGWSYRFVRWQQLGNRERGNFWNDYTLGEAQRQIRTRELLRILTEAKSSGNGVILFVQRVFLAEMCIRVTDPRSRVRLTADL
jgi:hypothetical protein